MEALTDEGKIGCHVALTPTWNESAYFADYVLPMGLGSERHDIHSYETHDAQWLGFRQPVLRAARERMGETVTDTRDVNPGEVWEENEFWIDLSWQIDPDGSLGIRRFFESLKVPGEKLGVDEYYGWIFENSVPGLPEKAAAEGLKPLEYMRRYGAFEIATKVGQIHEQQVPAAELEDTHTDGISSRARGHSHGRQRSGVYEDGEAGVAQRCADQHPGPRRRGSPAGRGRDRRRGPTRLPNPERPARVLQPDARRVGMAGIRHAAVHPLPCAPGGHGTGPDGADPDLPRSDPDPHSKRQLQMAR